jgi:hypothetical protein
MSWAPPKAARMRLKLRMLAHLTTLRTPRAPITNQMYLHCSASTERTLRDYWPQPHTSPGGQFGFRRFSL